MVKEVIIKFDDGDYTIRQDKVGDTIIGETAHKVMFAMMKASNYEEWPMDQKILFIISNSEQK